MGRIILGEWHHLQVCQTLVGERKILRIKWHGSAEDVEFVAWLVPRGIHKVVPEKGSTRMTT